MNDDATRRRAKIRLILENYRQGMQTWTPDTYWELIQLYEQDPSAIAHDAILEALIMGWYYRKKFDEAGLDG